MAQTLSVTTLGELRGGDRVNLEHAVTPTGMLGGHVMQGHVDGVGLVRQALRSADGHRLRIAPPTPQAMRLIVDKGSIAVNGVSLTVAAVGDDWFDVALIPTTLALTNLGSLREGDQVNLEYDYLAKVVVNWLERRNV
jgi:riboflavin synthase